MDLAHGYLQTSLKEEARSKTAFIPPDVTGEFTRAQPGPTKQDAVVKFPLRTEEFIRRFGFPERIISDKGSCFTSRKFENFSKQYGIKHTYLQLQPTSTGKRFGGEGQYCNSPYVANGHFHF